MQEPACYPVLDDVVSNTIPIKRVKHFQLLTYQLQLNTAVSLLNAGSLESLIILAFRYWVFRLKEQQVYCFAGQSNI
jgi:hypothetical protein